MKNYFKKFNIMLIMALSIIGIGMIQNGSTANAATVGQQLLQPESGWRRIDSSESGIDSINPGKGVTQNYDMGYNSSLKLIKYDPIKGDGFKFNFTGTKIRIIALKFFSYSDTIKLDIDNGGYTTTFSEFVNNTSRDFPQSLVVDIQGLSNTEHCLKFTSEDGKMVNIDAIDIEKDGNLLPYSEIKKSISLNKSLLDLLIGTSETLTATTTPAAAEVIWTSSDSSIATVDSNGKVTGIKEGQATITAQIKGSETKATCTVTVTKNEPINPAEPTGDGTLYIEMVDGNVKQAQDLDVADFIKWFKNRDLDDNDNPIYKIKNAKGNVEYLVHDKVVGFEVR